MKPFSLEEYLKNPSKKVVTRDGRNVKIYCTNYYHEHPIIAQIEGEERSHVFRETGHYNIYGESMGDLFFAPEKHEGWINVYRDTYTGTTSFGAVLYASREEAEEVGKPDDYYVATAKIEWGE